MRDMLDALKARGRKPIVCETEPHTEHIANIEDHGACTSERSLRPPLDGNYRCVTSRRVEVLTWLRGRSSTSLYSPSDAPLRPARRKLDSARLRQYS